MSSTRYLTELSSWLSVVCPLSLARRTRSRLLSATLVHLIISHYLKLVLQSKCVILCHPKHQRARESIQHTQAQQGDFNNIFCAPTRVQLSSSVDIVVVGCGDLNKLSLKIWTSISIGSSWNWGNGQKAERAEENKWSEEWKNHQGKFNLHTYLAFDGYYSPSMPELRLGAILSSEKREMRNLFGILISIKENI